MRSLSCTVKVRRRGRAEISGDTAAGAGTIFGRRPSGVPAPAAVSRGISGMGMTESSYRILKGKLPGGRCLTVIAYARNVVGEGHGDRLHPESARAIFL